MPKRIENQRMRVLRVATTALWLVVSLFSFASLPAGARERSIFMSHEEEEAIGRRAAAEVAQTMGLLDDPNLQAYVDSIGQRLARAAPRQDVTYRFAIVNMIEPNAFALPGGYIYVSRGLLELTNSEAELANVLAHEIAHVSERHSVERDAQQKAAQVFSILGIIVGVAAGSGQAAAAAGMFGQSWMAAYSRDQEREADELGQDFAYRAGFNPEGMSDFLHTLDNWTRLSQGASRQASYFDSHPTTPERVAKASTRALSLLGRAGNFRSEITPGEYLKRLEGLVVGEDPAGGAFDGSNFYHADLDFRLRFPEGWSLHNSQLAVGAVSPNTQDAMVSLDSVTEGTDPEKAAHEARKRDGLRFLEEGALRVGALPAYRARWQQQAQQQALIFEATWIAYAGRIFRIVGVSTAERFRMYQAAFQSTVRSFRPLTEEEHAKLKAVRIHIVMAREKEDLSALSARTQNVWTQLETAVYNGVFADVVFDQPRLVKVAVSDLYVPSIDMGKGSPSP